MWKTKQVECKQCKGTGHHKQTTFKNNWYLFLFLSLFVAYFSTMCILSIWIINTYHSNIEHFIKGFGNLIGVG